MSSKIFPPDGAASAGPVLWRRVNTEVSGAREAPAEPDIDQLRAAWQEECDRLVRQARASGFAEGEAAGRSQASSELQPVLQRLARSIDEMSHLRARLRREAEGDMVRLALAIARRVLRREMAIDPDAMHGLVLGALEKLQSQEISRVRVHPSQASQVSACLRQHAVGGAIEVVPDATREPGAVIFESERGNLDAGVDSQLQEIERGLTDRLQRQA